MGKEGRGRVRERGRESGIVIRELMIGLYMYYLHSTPIPSDMKQKLLIPYQNFTTFILSYSSLAGFVCVDKNLIKACLHN